MNKAGWIVVLVLASTRVYAQPTETCAVEAAELRTHLEIAERNAHWWNLSWAVVFGASAAGQLGLALTKSDPSEAEQRDALYVGAMKSTIGFAARLVTPLRVDLPTASADACADVAALRRAVERTARQERQMFWLNHVGALAVNLAGMIVLAHRHWSTGAVSFALGYPVGLLSNYTMPRASWHLWRDHHATWTVTALDGGWSLGIAGDL